MFRAERLVRITIQIPEAFISAATTILARFKLLHLVRIEETHLGRLGYVAKADPDLAADYEDLMRQAKSLLDGLGVPPAPMPLQEQTIPEKEVFRIKERVAQIRAEVDSVLGDLRAAEQQLKDHTTLKEKLALLPADLDFGRLMGGKFVNWVVGLVPARGLEKLEESLSEIHHAMIDLGTVHEQVVILVCGLKNDWPTFERALKGALFERIEIPAGFTGTLEEISAGIRLDILALEDQKKRLSARKEAFRERFGTELLLLKERIIAARLILSARGLFGKVDKTYVLSGWLPIRLSSTLRDELSTATQGQLLFEEIDPEDLRDVREGVAKIPILFNNPLLIRPFEKLTSLYGTPRYQEVEPTVFFALSFLLMFGMMFGDAGQGAVLFLLGYFIFRYNYRYMDYGVIFMECGLSSVLFGCLYGSVFGLEHIIPALWFRPMENIAYFVKVALVVGVALVSLGFVLNLINALRLKEYRSLLSAGGLAGTLFYWMLAGSGLKYLFTGRLASGELKLIGWGAAILTAIMLLHRPVLRVLGRYFKRLRPGETDRPEGIFTEFMESVVEVFDGIIRYLANTISFVRLAAFALTHAALFMAVFSIANVLSHGKGSGLSYWLVVIIGNFLVILLEGLVVSIQTVRLEYYEFFGKFFRGGGEPFKSLDRAIGSEEKKA
jgi:V/A-type H+-transporting ATPase subunit I